MGFFEEIGRGFERIGKELTRTVERIGKEIERVPQNVEEILQEPVVQVILGAVGGGLAGGGPGGAVLGGLAPLIAPGALPGQIPISETTIQALQSAGTAVGATIRQAGPRDPSTFGRTMATPLDLGGIVGAVGQVVPGLAPVLDPVQDILGTGGIPGAAQVPPIIPGGAGLDVPAILGQVAEQVVEAALPIPPRSVTMAGPGGNGATTAGSQRTAFESVRHRGPRFLRGLPPRAFDAPPTFPLPDGFNFVRFVVDQDGKIRVAEITDPRGRIRQVKLTKRRRMNPLNPRALTRSLRRIESFQRVVKRSQRLLRAAAPSSPRRRRSS